MGDYRIIIEAVGPHGKEEVAEAKAFVKNLSKRANVVKAHYEVEPAEVVGSDVGAVRTRDEIGECFDLKTGKVLRHPGKGKSRVVEDLESDSEE